MSGGQWLKALKGKVWPVMPVAFDTEGTGDPDGFVMGAVFDSDGGMLFNDREQMKRHLLGRHYLGSILYAHNAEYDWGVLWGDDSKGWHIFRASSRWILGEYRDDSGHIWKLHDTGNLSYFQSLEALGEILGLPKGRTPEYLKAGEGEYIKATDLTMDQRKEVGEYVLRDARIVYEYVCHLQEIVNGLGGNVKSTQSSTALDIFRRGLNTQNPD
jgi:hypothetical protein